MAYTWAQRCSRCCNARPRRRLLRRRGGGRTLLMRRRSSCGRGSIGAAAAAGAAIGVLLLAGPSAAHEASTAGGGGGTARLVRMLDSSRAGITIPAGIAFSQQANAFFVVEGVPQGGAAPGETAVAQVTPFGSRVASTAVSYAIRAPINVAFDERRQRLLMLDGASTLLEIPLQGARLDVSRISRADVTSGHLQNPQGITVDPKTGTLFVLDAAGQRLVRFDPTSDGTLPGATSSVDLGPSSVQLRGIAFDAGSGDLYTVGVAERQLYELTGGGSVVAVRDLAPFGRREPQGLLVAPTTDQTDAADGTSVFLANSGVPINSAAGSRRAAAVQQPGGIAELSLTAATTTGTASFTSSLVRTTDTAAWSPPSPDPSGIAYLPKTKTLLITDGEVEETVSGITHFAGANIWETSLGGTVARTTNISKIAPTAARITNEPTGVAWNPTNGHFYVSDDDDQRVYDVNPGGDGNLGTADDTWSYFSTIGTGNGDPEGITYDTWHDRVFVSDGVNREIYQYTTNGTPIGHFDVEAYGVDDPESVEFNPDSGTLFVLSNHASEVIVEVSTGGSYLRTIDVTAAGGLAPAGLAYAPASDGSSAKHFYVVDRRVDNNDDPTEVDGKLYELTAPAPTAPGNIPPTVDAGADQAVTLPNAATLDGTVADDGLPNPPGTTSVTWADVAGPSTVTFANPTAVDTTASFPIAGTYVLRLTATDGEYQTFDELTVTVTGTGSIASLDMPVKASTDDAEEWTNNSMQMTSADLDMMLDVASTGTHTNLADGMRFNGIAIPRNATITNAYVQFVASEVESTATQLTIQAQATDNAPAFTTTNRDISSRARTTAATLWSVDPWMAVGDSKRAERTPSLAAVIQEVVNRSGWANGNSIALIVTGTGQRVAKAFDTASGVYAPVLHVEWQISSQPNAAPTVSIDPIADVTLPAGTSVSGHVSDDGLPNPPGTTTLNWTKQSGPGTVSFTDATAATTTVSFSSAGSYVLRLTANDSALSSYADVTVTVNPAAATNTAPSVSIDPVAPITLPAGANLTGHVSDDGLPNPPGETTLAWTKQSGPGTASFTNATTAATTVSFSAAGSYVLRLTANDSALSSYADVTVTVNPEPTLFVDGFETGTLAAWSSSATDNGDLLATTAAALAGAYGMQAGVNDNNPIFVTDTSPVAEQRYRARFLFNPNSIAMAKGDAHLIFAGLDSNGASLLQIDMRSTGSLRYDVRASLLTDGTQLKSTGWTGLSNARHSLEIDWRASTAPGANNGSVTLWVDGAQTGAMSAIDNDTRRIESVGLGAVSGIDTGTRGTYYFDAFVSQRYTYIGP